MPKKEEIKKLMKIAKLDPVNSKHQIGAMEKGFRILNQLLDIAESVNVEKNGNDYKYFCDGKEVDALVFEMKLKSLAALIKFREALSLIHI